MKNITYIPLHFTFVEWPLRCHLKKTVVGIFTSSIEEKPLIKPFFTEDVRCSDSPGSNKKRGGITRFALISRLAKVKTLNGSEVTGNENNNSKVVKVLQDVLEIVTNDMMRNGSRTCSIRVAGALKHLLELS
nr:tubulin-folding cofactor E [Tanacetum cinerariifolium]GEW41602.1 tubulin-folding cofactor E [Tanacetum cinerariifolium]